MLKLYIYIYMYVCMYVCILCVFAQNWLSMILLLMNSYSIDVVVVMRCCCWWLKPWVIIVIELWCEIYGFWKFYKNGSNGDLWWNDVLVQVLYGFECLFMSINVYTNIGNKFGHWRFKIGILERKWDFTRELTVIARHGEQISGHGEWWNVQLAMASDLVAMASCSVQQLLFLSF